MTYCMWSLLKNASNHISVAHQLKFKALCDWINMWLNTKCFPHERILRITLCIQNEGNHKLDCKRKSYTICSIELAFVNLISKKHTKHLVKCLWILLSLCIKLMFSIEPPKELVAASAQIDPEDFTSAPISIFLPPAAFLPLCAPTIKVAQATIVVVIRFKHDMLLAKKQTKAHKFLMQLEPHKHMGDLVLQHKVISKHKCCSYTRPDS